MEWTNELIIQFLDLYEDEDVIWNPKNEKHKNRNDIHDAWKRIQSKLNVNISLEEIKKKRDSLMATFRKLSAKVKSSMKTGSGSDDVFKPEWFAYEKMAKFLFGMYNPRKTINSEELEEEVTHVPEENDGECENDISSNVSVGNEEGSFKTPPIKRRKMQVGTIEKRMDEAYNFLKSMKEKPVPDECDLFTELLSKKIRALDENSREIAMHEINNLMYRVKQSMLQSQSSYGGYSLVRCPQTYTQAGYLPHQTQPPFRYSTFSQQSSDFPPPFNPFEASTHTQQSSNLPLSPEMQRTQPSLSPHTEPSVSTPTSHFVSTQFTSSPCSSETSLLSQQSHSQQLFSSESSPQTDDCSLVQ